MHLVTSGARLIRFRIRTDSPPTYLHIHLEIEVRKEVIGPSPGTQDKLGRREVLATCSSDVVPGGWRTKGGGVVKGDVGLIPKNREISLGCGR